jgi:copper transport protein
MTRSSCKVLAGLVAALALAVGGATTASAHAYLIASDPGNGAILSTAPKQALLQFNVPVTVRLSSASLVDATGKPVPGAAIRSAPGNQSVIVVDLPALPQGAYRLTYTTWDSIDLHKTGGAIDFGIGEAAAFAADTSTAERPSYVETGTRWLELAGITLLIGLAAVWVLVLPALGRRVEEEQRRQVIIAARRALPPLATLGYVAVLLGKVGQLGVALAALTAGAGPSVAQAADAVLLTSRFGELWVLGMVLAIIVLLAAHLAVSRRGRAWQGAVLVAGTLALAAVYAQSSHGTNQSGFDAGQVAFRLVHLVAAGVWVGGLTVLAVLFVGPLRSGTLGRPAALKAFQLYGGLAVVSVGALAASGLVLAGASIASPELLITSTYGWTLIAKVLAVAVVMVAGLRHSRAGGLPPLPSLSFELGAMLIVLWGAAALGATAPATAPPVAAAPASAPILGTNTTQLVQDMTVQTSMTPGHPGPNTLFVQIHGNPNVPFRPITSISITMSGPGQAPRVVTGTFIGRGRYEFGQVTIPDTGELAVSEAITRSPGPDASVQFDWPITPSPPTYIPLSLPTAPWASTLDLAATAIGVLVGLWLLAAMLRSRIRGDRVPATP